MFKIKLYESGLREVYFGKKQLFRYRNLVQGVIFNFRSVRRELENLKQVNQNLQNAKNEIKNHTNWLKFDTIEHLRREKGIYHFQSLLRRAHIHGKYYSLFL